MQHPGQKFQKLFVRGSNTSPSLGVAGWGSGNQRDLSKQMSIELKRQIEQDKNSGIPELLRLPLSQNNAVKSLGQSFFYSCGWLLM